MTFLFDQVSPEKLLAAGQLADWIERATAMTPNRGLLQHRLDSIATTDLLARFLHRFLLFNDALAARVPLLAGRLHLTQNLFVAAGDGPAFSRQRNGTIARPTSRKPPATSTVWRRAETLCISICRSVFSMPP